jgi:hypothetical protein
VSEPTVPHAPTCDHILYWTAGGVALCDRVAVCRYRAYDGEWYHFCLEHGREHEAYAERCYTGEGG